MWLGAGFGQGRGAEQVDLELVALLLAFEGLQGVAGVVQHGSGHACQFGNLYAVAAAGGAGLNGVQEDYCLPRFGGADVDVYGGVVAGGELG